MTSHASPPLGRDAVIAVIAGFLGRIAMTFNFAIVGALGPALVYDAGLSLSELGILVAVFNLPAIVIALPGGYLSERFGGVALGFLAAIFMVVGSTISAIDPSFTMLLVGRIIAGVGATIITIVSNTILGQYFSGRALANVMALSMVSWPVGFASAFLVMPSVAADLGLATALWLAAGVCVLVLPAFAILLLWPQTPATARPGGFQGMVRLTRQELALVLTAAMLWLCFNGGFVILMSFGPAHIASGGVDGQSAAQIMAVTIIAAGIVTPFAGAIVNAVGRPMLIMVVCMVVMACSTLGFIVVGPNPVLLALAGLAMALPVPSLMSIIVESVAPDRRNMAMGAFYTLFYTGLAALPAIAGWTGDIFATTAAPLVFGAALTLPGAVMVMRFSRLRAQVAATPVAG
jgi:MFS family permease